jgi:hypothetical protein
MQARLHLISMPWANPAMPSIQNGVLKAYVDSTLGDHIQTFTYSAFVSILLEETRRGVIDHFERLEEYEEYPYFLMFLRRYLRNAPGARGVSIDRLLSRVNANVAGADEPLTSKRLVQLELRTRRYVRDVIGPQLDAEGVNVVGFTLNYFQFYASIYCARALRELFPDHDFLFLFGGATVIYPKVAEAFERLGIEGVCVIGEGEQKLELILREVMNTPPEERSALIERIVPLHLGFYDTRRCTVNLYEPNAASLLSLQMSVDNLPLPAFDEYYESVRNVFRRDDRHTEYRAETWLAMEGTRGCFAKCDFCDVHSSWSGFRRSSAERIADRAIAMALRHRTARVKFMDNVCDTWGEEYADRLIARKIRLTSFMECRVHHPERFWTKLSLAGVEMIQVGIEALSPSLLQAMNKGTRAKQNLLVQKWLKELGIESLSNLISHHPKSTLDHVAETRKIVELIPHLDRLDFSPLALLFNTPLDRKLTPEQRRSGLVERQPFSLPKSLDPYFVRKGEYEPPDEWFVDGVIEAWDGLIAWEETFRKRCGENASMVAARCSEEEILISDRRYGSLEEHLVEGDDAYLYSLCHHGATLESLVNDLDLPLERVQAIAAALIERKVLVELEGCYIALALRPRDELVHECMMLPGSMNVSVAAA